MAFNPPPLTPFAQHLVAEGLIMQAQAFELADQARAEETPFTIYLENKKWISAAKLAASISRFYALPLYDLNAHQTSKIPMEFMSLSIVQKGLAIPLLRRKNTLFFGVADPEPINLNELSFSTNTQVKLIIVEADKLQIICAELREAQMVAGLENIGENALADLDITTYQEEPNEGAQLVTNIDEKPIVAYINQLLLEAIKVKASDIHFEHYEKQFRIRFRIDGILHEASRSPVQAAPALVARLKVISGLDIAEHRLPQDGRFKVNLGRNKTIDFRISTCPTIYGEKVVLRILDPDAIGLDVDILGMDNQQQSHYLNAVHQPQGIILVTGPTGSGKTVSLYTAINLLNSIQKNICTIEDPIEIYMPGVNQVHMNPKTGMSFVMAMRAFLRQDPDIIMVGEIRDQETADIAVKAAQTGHLVLSTLHTNSAPMTIMRLANIGLEPYNIASSLSLIIAQRLVRKLCRHCKKSANIPHDILLAQGFSEADLNTPIYEPGQCSKCTNGYRGRTGIFEVMPVTPAIKDIILHGGDVNQITEQAIKEGMITLRESGLIKVKAGTTSLEELNRVIT